MRESRPGTSLAGKTGGKNVGPPRVEVPRVQETKPTTHHVVSERRTGFISFSKLHGSRGRFQLHLVAQLLSTAHEPLLDRLPIPFIEVIASQFLIVFVLRQEL